MKRTKSLFASFDYRENRLEKLARNQNDEIGGTGILAGNGAMKMERQRHRHYQMKDTDVCSETTPESATTLGIVVVKNF